MPDLPPQAEVLSERDTKAELVQLLSAPENIKILRGKKDSELTREDGPEANRAASALNMATDLNSGKEEDEAFQKALEQMLKTCPALAQLRDAYREYITMKVNTKQLDAGVALSQRIGFDAVIFNLLLHKDVRTLLTALDNEAFKPFFKIGIRLSESEKATRLGELGKVGITAPSLQELSYGINSEVFNKRRFRDKEWLPEKPEEWPGGEIKKVNDHRTGNNAAVFIVYQLVLQP